VRVAGSRRGTLLGALLLSVMFCMTAQSDGRQPRMGIFTKEGARIDLSLQFVDAMGERESLRSVVIPERPFILVPVFYRCPRLCGLTLSGVSDLINRLPITLGEDYSVVAYSFNPADTVADASEKRRMMMAHLSRPPSRSEAVRFLLSDPETISAINEQLGFRVRYADKELEHSSAIFIVSPNGEIRRYFAGVDFDPHKVGAILRGG
jgi:protein SCO1/2